MNFIILGWKRWGTDTWWNNNHCWSTWTHWEDSQWRHDSHNWNIFHWY